MKIHHHQESMRREPLLMARVWVNGLSYNNICTFWPLAPKIVPFSSGSFALAFLSQYKVLIVTYVYMLAVVLNSTK